MNVPIAIPAHIGADGIWIEFVSPTSGKSCAINMMVLLASPPARPGLIEDALHEWMLAQLETWKKHNPMPEPGKPMPEITGFPIPPAPPGTLL